MNEYTVAAVVCHSIAQLTTFMATFELLQMETRRLKQSPSLVMWSLYRFSYNPTPSFKADRARTARTGFWVVIFSLQDSKWTFRSGSEKTALGKSTACTGDAVLIEPISPRQEYRELLSVEKPWILGPKVC